MTTPVGEGRGVLPLYDRTSDEIDLGEIVKIVINPDRPRPGQRPDTPRGGDV